MIEGKSISYTYEYDENGKKALNNLTFSVKPGEFIAILGCNGCGKSTLVKHLDALLELQQGELMVAGLDAGKEENIWELRRKVGMVFQNPDNQFVSSVVEEDIAFGLENYDMPRKEIPIKVKEALHTVGMDGFEKRSPHMLSGGQKQRIALAGVLAMEPDIIAFDEATAMLDPEGREEMLTQMLRLHDQGKTILMITHYVEEAVNADRVFLMKEGRIIATGNPQEILTNIDALEEAGLEPPMPVRLYYDLRREGIRLPKCPITKEELAKELSERLMEQLA